MMTPQDKMALDRVQHQVHLLNQRLDALCAQMAELCAEVKTKLELMAYEPKGEKQ
jgi:hypothetical protein